MRYRVRALLHGLGRHWGLVALVALALLVDSGPTVAAHGATSLDIIVWRHVVQAPVFQPDVKVFDQTMTDFGLVHDIQDQLDGGAPSGIGSCTIGSPEYVYQFRLATLGVTTQVYTGSDDCGGWDATTLGISRLRIIDEFPYLADQVAVRAITLDGVEILQVLHQRTGMPCEVTCSGSGPSDGDRGMPCTLSCPGSR
jgi:hypothetical protein